MERCRFIFQNTCLATGEKNVRCEGMLEACPFPDKYMPESPPRGWHEIDVEQGKLVYRNLRPFADKIRQDKEVR